MLDLAWTAGFIEGEGNFGQPGKRSTGNGRIYATQKDPECLYRLQRLFGGSVMRRKRPTPFGESDIHDWSCFGAPALGLMLTIYSLMSARRKAQIRAAVQGIQARRAAMLANKKTWRWQCDETGKRRYVDVSDRVAARRASEAGSGAP